MLRSFLKTALIICLGVLMASESLAKDGDWQLWTTESIEGNFAKNWKVKLEEEFRVADDMEELYYHHTDGGLSYRLTGIFSFGINYRQIFERKKGEWKDENRPHIHGTIKWKWQDFEFEDRNRFEYRIRAGKESVWRYRNKLTIAIPPKSTNLDIQAYLADEVFADLGEGEFSRNRLYAGVGANLMKHLAAGIFYLWQSSKNDKAWIDFNIVGVRLKVKL
jgi:hypothetical protein